MLILMEADNFFVQCSRAMNGVLLFQIVITVDCLMKTFTGRSVRRNFNEQKGPLTQNQANFRETDHGIMLFLHGNWPPGAILLFRFI